MRSAERLFLVWVAASALTGCATVSDGFSSVKQSIASGVDTVAATLSAPAVPAGGAAGGAAAPAPAIVLPRADTEPPVSPPVNLAYNNALRALRAGRTEEAERGLRALVASNPELGGPHANLGLIHRQAGRLPEAVSELELAVAASPRQPAYFNQLGISYRQNGQFTKARDAYEKALDLDPQYASACLNLGILHDLYLWDGQRALALYERYLALTPGGDAAVSKWAADLKNRKPAQAAAPARKETP
jgi:hypothetical protein